MRYNNILSYIIYSQGYSNRDEVVFRVSITLSAFLSLVFVVLVFIGASFLAAILFVKWLSDDPMLPL